jgi:hypothetical protein
MNRWSFAALALIAVAGLLCGCSARKGAGRSPGPLLDEHAGEFRAVVVVESPGAGAPAVIVLDPRGPQLATLGDGGWTLVSLGATAPGVEWYGMTSGDLDGDGGDEVVLWGFRPQIVSLVLTWQGDQLARVAGPFPELLRIVRHDGQDVVYGQRAGATGPFAGPVFRHELVGRDLVRREAMGALVDILDFFFAPAEGQTALYAWADDGTLERRQTGTAVWRSDELRMTRPLNRERERENLLGESRSEIDEYPTLPVVQDVDGDGTDEVLVVTSDAPKVQVLERVRVFRGGTLARLVPEGRGLAPAAESILLGRFATGLAATDLDGDGDLEVLVSVVLQRRSGVGRGRSALAAFDAVSGDLLELGRPEETAEVLPSN